MFVKGYYYHIYNRGCNKENIFFNDANYLYLLAKMKSSYNENGINILAYCLMPNHYHFLIQQITDNSISKWLQKVFVGYSQAINKQQNRSGTLFEGRPKHIPIEKEEYLLHLMWYIHNNPVVANLVSSLDKWQFSNYLECIGKRNGSMFNKEFIKHRFGSLTEYEKFMIEYQVDKCIEEKIEKYLFD